MTAHEAMKLREQWSKIDGARTTLLRDSKTAGNFGLQLRLPSGYVKNFWSTPR